MSRDLSGALMAEQVAEIGARFLQAEFAARAALLVADAARPPAPPAVADTARARRAASRNGRSTTARPPATAPTRLPAQPLLYLPLKAPMRAARRAGDRAAQPRGCGRSSARLLDTCASLLAISLERIHYVDVAQRRRCRWSRSACATRCSRDLARPAHAAGRAGRHGRVAGADAAAAAPAHARARAAIGEAALRMSALVNNLLDMARLQSGPVQLNPQWQPLEEVVGSALRAARHARRPRRCDVRCRPTCRC